jgi:hypothetical protein
MLIPFFAIAFIMWAVRTNARKCRRSKYCVNILLDDPVPDEITVPGKTSNPPDVELVNASTWKTRETCDGTDDEPMNHVSMMPSSETSDISTDFVEMK